jgi:plasmid stability protein
MAEISLIALEFRALASITIRNLEDALKRKLRVRAARHGGSMEDEALLTLRSAPAEEPHEALNLFEAIRRRIALLGGMDLEIPRRGPMREPPRFDE